MTNIKLPDGWPVKDRFELTDEENIGWNQAIDACTAAYLAEKAANTNKLEEENKQLQEQLDDAYKTLRACMMVLEPKTCKWEEVTPGNWLAGCGYAPENIVPDQSNINYCPHCGHKIEVVK